MAKRMTRGTIPGVGRTVPGGPTRTGRLGPSRGRAKTPNLTRKSFGPTASAPFARPSRPAPPVNLGPTQAPAPAGRKSVPGFTQGATTKRPPTRTPPGGTPTATPAPTRPAPPGATTKGPSKTTRRKFS
jgi:hypothetical protein